MMQNLKIELLPVTEASAKAFLADLDRHIDELDANINMLKTVRTAVARTFGVDRRDGSYIERLVDGAKRAETEVSEEALERELALQIPPETSVVLIDPLSNRQGSVK